MKRPLLSLLFSLQNCTALCTFFTSLLHHLPVVSGVQSSPIHYYSILMMMSDGE